MTDRDATELIAAQLRSHGIHADAEEVAAVARTYRYFQEQVDRLYRIPGLGDTSPAAPTDRPLAPEAPGRAHVDRA
jgi:hypothetical protein